MKKTYGAKFRPGILLENGNKKDETYHVVACEAQTLFFGGREATTGNASALRRLTMWRVVVVLNPGGGGH